MYLERLLQINMATLAALGALLLGMGQRSEGPPLLVTLAAVVSVWLTDITGWFRISRRVANVLMLLAAAISLRELFPLASELQALGFSWFLIYLQVILLFQQKDERVYWLLVMLSLLQVVVATLFSQGVWFGVLLATYMLLGFSAMTLLLMYREWERYRPKETPSSVPRWDGSCTAVPRFAEQGQQYNCRPNGPQPDFVCQPGGSSHAGVCRDLFGRLGRMGLHTLALTLVLFFTVPRFGQVAWRGSIASPQPLVGFSDKVTLGELGQIIESRDEVMRVRFYDHRSDVPQPVYGEVYLRGALLMLYEHGQWQTGTPTWDVGNEALDRARRLPDIGLVRQEITIEGTDHDELFYVAPHVPLSSNSNISFDLARLRLLRSEHLRNQRFEYKLGTTAIVDGIQKPLTPARANESTRNARIMPKADGPGGLPNLAKLARRWIAESGLPQEDRVGRARYLERQLAASGRFQYSLTGQARNPDIDPIEDFLTEHPQGHCEYFATALTLMLRSQGIPARMVLGYKCDEWNALGHYFQVRQLHAHTWVEAYLRPRQIPPALMHGKDYWRWQDTGGWLQLDPTPASAGIEEDSGLLSPLRRAMDWFDSVWSNYVVEMNSQRQRDAVYQPIGRALREAWQEATDPRRWRAMFDAVLAALHLDELTGAAERLVIVAAGILAAAVLAGAGWLLWWVGGRLRARWTGNHARLASRRTKIEFYRRFETILARQGLVRRAGQTQREFAEAAGMRFALVGKQAQLAPLPRVVVDAFYRVRFGRQPLDSIEAQAVEHAIRELSEMKT